MKTISRKPTRKRAAVKLRTNGKHKVDAASTINAPLNFGLQRILRPQSIFRWLPPQIAAITPMYIEATLSGAMAGNHVQQWALFDLMLKTWPELLACYTELIQGVLRKKMIFEPFHEEDEKPSPTADERMKLVCSAVAAMAPDPSRDDNTLEDTIKDILDAWFRGVAVDEIVWQMVDTPGMGTIAAPQSTFSVDPTNYAFSNEGVLGLRMDRKAMGAWPFSTVSNQPQPSELSAFPPNKFLIAKHKSSFGSPLGGALLRPLAWWWCAANFSSDWLLNLAQVFGLPFRFANYDPNMPDAGLQMLDSMLQNMGSNGWARFPTGTTLELIQPSNQGSDHSPQGELLDRADRYARLLILGQTMTGTHGTTGKGGGQAFGTVEADVKSDRIDAAGKFASEIINNQLVKSILLLNYGDADEAPKMRFLEDEEAGLTEAQRDKVLIKDVGLEVSTEYIRKKYGLPEPANEEDTLGGAPELPPGFDQFMQDGQQQDAENPTEEKASDEEPEVKSGDAPGHAFRGNQYTEGHVERFQWMRNKEGGQKFGNQQEIRVLDDHLFQKYVRPRLGKDYPTLAAYQKAYPGQTHISLFKREGTGDWRFSAIGKPKELRPSSGSIQWTRKVDTFDSTQAVEHGFRADSESFQSIRQSAEDERRQRLNAQLHTKLLELNAITDDAVFARELQDLAATLK